MNVCAGGFCSQGRAAALAAVVLVPRAAAVASPIVTGADTGVTHVKQFDGASLAEQKSFFAYGPSATGGVRVAAGDVNGDGVADIVTGTGPGAAPQVKAFDGATNSEVRSFFAYAPTFTGGVYVAAGDVTGDLRADLVTGTGAGAGQVKVFDAVSLAEVRSFVPFGGFTGGVRVAAGDVNGDGRADLVAGTGPGAAQVKAFDGRSGAEIASFLPYEAGFSSGVFVAAGDITGDGRADLITGTDAGAPAHVKVFDGRTLAEVRSFFAYDVGFTGGVRVGAGDVNGDGRVDLLTSTGPGGGQVKAFDGISGAEIQSFLPYGTFTGGLFVAGVAPVPEPSSPAAAAAATTAALLRRRQRRRNG